jgi:AcrR family transcriptional regulator
MTKVRSELPTALVRAAEQLFAERGSDVSLRDITAAAGAGNASAVNYHFGDRRGLVRAVLEKHDADVERRRHALLDAYEAHGEPSVRQLAAALVEPLAEELSNDDGGHGYLQLLSDLYNRPNPTFAEEARRDRTSSFERWRALALPLLEPDAVRLHRRFDALRFTVSELARRARTGRKDHRLFTSQLTDLVAGLLGAPVSDETRQLFR